jgi:RHS repeat-associated protein
VQETTKLVTNGSQTITSTQETEAFGRFIGGTGSTASPYGYHGADGYRQDGDGPAGLEPYQKVGARYYDATFGRFITRDTDLSQAPYVYCNGDPVNCSDPTGHDTALPATAETAAHNDITDAMGDIASGAGSDPGGSDPGGSNPGGGPSGGSGGSSGGSAGSSGSGTASPGNQTVFTPTKNGGYNITFNNGPLSQTDGFDNHNNLTSIGGGLNFPINGVPGLSVYGTGTVSLTTGNSSYTYGLKFTMSF